MAVLKIISEQQPNALYQIEHEKTVFGRHPNCQIVLDNAAVSRHHAQILESHGSYYIEDLRSRNGTILNEQEVEGRQPLSQGDTLKVCDYTFIFYLQRPEDDSTVIPSKRNPGIDTGSWKRPTKTFDKNGTDGGDEDDDEVDDGERSSIISTLDTGSSSSLHLGSKPEMKLKAIVEISTSLGQVLDLDEALRIILDGLFTIYSQADEGAILLLDQNDKLTIRKRKSRRDSDGDEGRSCVSMTIAKKKHRNASGDSQCKYFRRLKTRTHGQYYGSETSICDLCAVNWTR